MKASSVVWAYSDTRLGAVTCLDRSSKAVETGPILSIRWDVKAEVPRFDNSSEMAEDEFGFHRTSGAVMVFVAVAAVELEQKTCLMLDYCSGFYYRIVDDVFYLWIGFDLF